MGRNHLQHQHKQKQHQHYAYKQHKQQQHYQHQQQTLAARSRREITEHRVENSSESKDNSNYI